MMLTKKKVRKRLATITTNKLKIWNDLLSFFDRQNLQSLKKRTQAKQRFCSLQLMLDRLNVQITIADDKEHFLIRGRNEM